MIIIFGMLELLIALKLAGPKSGGSRVYTFQMRRK